MRSAENNRTAHRRKHPLSGCRVGILLAWLTGLPFLHAEEWTGTADALMQRVRSTLPVNNLDLQGQLVTRNRQGQVRNVQEVDLHLRLGDIPPQSAYTLRSRFGDFREEVDVRWDAETGEAELRRRTEENGDFTSLADPYATIDETEISWADISLSFLWWPNGEIVGDEKKLGRRCQVLDLPAPEASGPYEGARLWVDPEIGAVLEIELHRRDEGRSKRIRIKSLRKVDDRWFLREMEVLNVNSYRRTSLILDVPETLEPAVSEQP